MMFDGTESPISELIGSLRQRCPFPHNFLVPVTVTSNWAHGLTLVPKAGTTGPFAKATVWVDDDDALIREFETTETNGVTRHIRLTSLEPNVTVNRSTFTFVPPKGVKVVDQTGTPD